MAVSMTSARGLLTVRQVAERLQVDDTTVRRWIKRGLLEAVVLPSSGTRNSYRVDIRTLEQILRRPIQEA